MAKKADKKKAPETVILGNLLHLGGFMWRPEWVYWGEAGAGNKMSFTCYWAKKDERGKFSKEEKKEREIDVWDIRCVYALLYENTVVYVGEGVLGDRLKEHRNSPEKSGRWDRFSWISPVELAADNQTLKHLTMKTPVRLELEAKKLIETVELAVLNLTMPSGNRQTPKDHHRIKWLTQVPADGAEMDIANNLKVIRTLLENMGEPKKTKAKGK